MNNLKLFLFLLFILWNSTAIGQSFQRNNNWTTGQNPVVQFNFSNALQITSLPNINSGIKSSSSCISDTNGVFQLYSNGFILYNTTGDTIENGIYVNCPDGKILANYYGGASLFDQTSIILPKQGNRYYVFSTGMSDSVATNYLNHIKTEFDVLNYSVVDMDSNNGKGKVIEKNSILSAHEHYRDCALHAVKHANGKDWWLIKADCSNNRFQEFYVKEDTILGPYYQYVPPNEIGDFCTWQSEIYFNPQGTKMASTMYGELIGSNFYYRNNVYVFDFNRCDGSITFTKNYRVPQDTSSYPNSDIKMGICFSGDGKLLYECNSYTVYQIDLLDTNSYNALLIHGPDTVLNSFPEYSNMALAPDGKIYIGNYNSTRKYMSYIDKPNVKGVGCDFIPNGVWQPYTNLSDPPNMPNYGLGADSVLLIGCAPVAIPTIPSLESLDFSVYPNPTCQTLYFQNARGKTKVIVNALGQIIVTTTQDNIDVSALAKGLYFIHCNNKTKKVLVE